MFALPWLVADIGGTNMRLGRILEPGGAVQDIARVATPRTGDLAPALEPYLDAFTEGRPRSAALALAGPIVAGQVQLTNSGAHLSARAAALRLGLDAVLLVNDLEAVAAALPRLSGTDVKTLGPDLATPVDGTRVVLGCGTGCGVGAAVWGGDRWHVLASEGGHLPFPAVTERDMRWRTLIARGLPAEARGRVTYDRVLCGSGLQALAETIAAETGATAPTTAPMTSEAIAEAARGGTNAVAVAAATHFAHWVGAFAGDLAQVFLARGGIYLAGALLEGLDLFLGEPAVRAAFTEKWPHDPLLAEIPLRLIVDHHAPLAGLGEILARRDPGPAGRVRPTRLPL
jgi:glucokinase